MMWTLVIFMTLGGPSITIEGFSRLEDCRDMGQLYADYVQVDKRVKFRCDKIGRK